MRVGALDAARVHVRDGDQPAHLTGTPPSVMRTISRPGSMPCEECGSPESGLGPRVEANTHARSGDEANRSTVGSALNGDVSDTVPVCAPVRPSKTSATLASLSPTQTWRSLALTAVPWASRSGASSS
ncbi:hypothetical protein ACFQYP_34870 [Nonomuraea antimicrobica]